MYGNEDDQFPADEFYRKISLEYYYQKIPVIRLLFATGTYFAGGDPVFLWHPAAEAEIWNSRVTGSGTVPYGLSAPYPWCVIICFLFYAAPRQVSSY